MTFSDTHLLFLLRVKSPPGPRSLCTIRENDQPVRNRMNYPSSGILVGHNELDRTRKPTSLKISNELFLRTSTREGFLRQNS